MPVVERRATHLTPTRCATLLLHADDIVLRSENHANLQRALNATAAWAKAWRFCSGTGPNNSAVMCFSRRPLDLASLQFHIGQQPFPVVRNYTYLGVVFHDRQRWGDHVDHVSHAVHRELLPACADTIDLSRFAAVVCGLEFVAEDRQLQRMSTRLFQSRRRLLMWPRSAPTAAVQGHARMHKTYAMTNMQLRISGRVPKVWLDTARLLYSDMNMAHFFCRRSSARTPGDVVCTRNCLATLREPRPCVRPRLGRASVVVAGSIRLSRQCWSQVRHA